MKFFAKQLNFFYGYIIVVVLWFVYFFNVSIPLYGGGVLNSMMVSATGMDPAIIGYATSLCTIMQGVAGPFVGMLIQKKGIRLPFILGSVFLVIGSLLIIFSTKNEISYVVFYGILIGLGMGFGGILTSQSAVNDWFNQKKAFAMALLLSAGGVGGFIAPILLNSVTSNGSWMNGWILTACLCTLSVILSVFFIISKPADIDDIPDGKKASTGTSKKGPSASLCSDANYGMPLKLVYRSSAFYGILITYVTRNALYYAITGQLIIYLVGSGVSPTAAAFSISIFSASSLIGRFITGFISGTILKPRTCTAGCNILMGIGMLLINAMPSASAIYFCTALMGLGLGAGFVGMPLCISHFFGSNNFSIINGTISPINYIIGASGPLLVSILATYTGSYGVAFSILSVIAIFGGIVLLRIKQPDYRPEKNFQ